MNIIYLFCCLWMTLGECSEEKLHSVLYSNQSGKYQYFSKIVGELLGLSLDRIVSYKRC